MNECKVQNVGDGELVRLWGLSGVGKGVIFADYFIPMRAGFAAISEI